MLLADSRESASREQAALERLVPVVQGFVIGNTRMPDAALRSIAQKRPTVMLNRALSEVPCVIPDNCGGVQAALQLLFDLGHRDVHYVAGPEASWPDGVRWRAVQELGPKIGLTVHRVGPTLPTFDGGLGAVQQLLPLRPTAVIGYNDLIAVGVLHGLLRSGVRVPQEVSVVGFDDILISRLVLPTLTTIAAPMRQMGTTALHNVVAVINGARPRATEPIVMPVHLKVRGSTGPGPADRAPVRA